MNLYLLSQSFLDGYETYDSCVVAAMTEYEAVRISPSNDGPNEIKVTTFTDGWPGLDRLNEIEVKLLGEALTGTASGVICASFNAG